MSRLFTNNAKSRLSGAIATDSVSLGVTTGTGSLFPTIPVGSTDFFVVTLEDVVGNKEIVKVTARSGDTFTIERAQENTTALSFAANSLVELRLTSEFIDSIKQGSIAYIIDGGGAAITAGVKGFIEAPFNATIKSVRLFADVSGDAVVDIYKDTYENYNPDIDPTASICANSSNRPFITGDIKSLADLAGWTVDFEKGDIFYFEVVSCSDITKLTISMSVERY